MHVWRRERCHAHHNHLTDGPVDPEEWILAVLEGDIDDVLPELGWQPCQNENKCRRAGRCVRR